MTHQELQALSDEALIHLGLSFEQSLTMALIRQRMGKLTVPTTLRDLRRNIARVQMVVGNREKAAGIQKGSLLSKHRSTFTVSAEPAASGENFLSSLLDGAQTV
jgi:ribosomal protein L29